MAGTEAIRQCRDSLARGSKSFALASRLLPDPARDHAAVLYAWCRHADDSVDRAPASRQSEALEALHVGLDQVYSSARPDDMVLAAFQDVVRSCGIPEVYPRELLAGMEMDARGYDYVTMHDLRLYCYRVASTVGLMMCHVMRLEEPWALRHAAHLGVAMQLTNICRDVAEDWGLGRLYIPDRLLEQVGYPGLRERLGTPLPQDARTPLSHALRSLLAEADGYYRSGDEGLPALRWRFALAIRAARLIYAQIGQCIADNDFDVFAGRAVVPQRDKLRLMGRALGGEVKGTPRRLRRFPSSLASRRPPAHTPRPLDSVALAGDVLPL